MLVLSRKSQESVIGVGGSDRFDESMVKVTVLAIGGDKVTLGFEGDASNSYPSF